jgi:hypothetical protein
MWRTLFLLTQYRAPKLLWCTAAPSRVRASVRGNRGELRAMTTRDQNVTRVHENVRYSLSIFPPKNYTQKDATERFNYRLPH